MRTPAWLRASFPALLGLLLAVGCSSSGALRTVLEESLRLRIDAAGLDPREVELPFRLTPEMREWARHTVKMGGSAEERLQRLLRHLLLRDGQTLVYQSGHTGTAQEVWETRRANCLAFTHLYVGMARELELPVYYLRVTDLQSYERDGDLVIASEHITAAYGPASQRRVLDFSDRPVTSYHAVQPISDLTAVALYYSNRGAELIRDGHSAEALRALEIAVALDPELPDGWVNYGVALRRKGRSAEAERAYRRALELDPRQSAAYQNLAALLRLQGREREAQDLLALTVRGSSRNPFSYLALGDLSLREGRLEEAERFYRRALRLEPELAEPHAALGLWALAAGREREARSWLRKAEKLDPESPRVDELARRIRSLQPG